MCERWQVFVSVANLEIRLNLQSICDLLTLPLSPFGLDWGVYFENVKCVEDDFSQCHTIEIAPHNTLFQENKRISGESAVFLTKIEAKSGKTQMTNSFEQNQSAECCPTSTQIQLKLNISCWCCCCIFIACTIEPFSHCFLSSSKLTCELNYKSCERGTRARPIFTTAAT